MKPSPSLAYPVIGLIALLVGLDEFIKQYAVRNFPGEETLTSPGIVEFALHENYGLAFNIPFRMPLILSFSAVIGVALVYIAYQHRKDNLMLSLAALTVVIGGIGNFIDRIIYGYAVDYIILLGRSAINISDIVILVGVIWLLVASQRSSRYHLLQPDKR